MYLGISPHVGDYLTLAFLHASFNKRPTTIGLKSVSMHPFPPSLDHSKRMNWLFEICPITVPAGSRRCPCAAGNKSDLEGGLRNDDSHHSKSNLAVIRPRRDEGTVRCSRLSSTSIFYSTLSGLYFQASARYNATASIGSITFVYIYQTLFISAFL